MSENGNIVEWRVSEDYCPNEGDSGSIVLWIFPDGSRVKKGDIVAEFMVEKVTHELLSPASGILTSQLEPEVEARRGDLLAVIHTE